MTGLTTARPTGIYKKDIVIGKGLAILLVVMSHILTRETPTGNEWYINVKWSIDMINMPFFVFISGYLHFKPDRLERISKQYASHIKDQSTRLLLPFLVIGITIVFGKTLMQYVMHVSNIPATPLSGLINLIWHTKYSAALFLWYVIAIFIYTTLSIPLFKLLKNKMFFWAVLALTLYTLPSIQYLYLDKLCMFFVFFCIGGLAIQNDEAYLTLLQKKLFILTSLTLFSGIIALYNLEILNFKTSTLCAGLSGIPFMHFIALKILQSGGKLYKTFHTLGMSAYSIYLLSMICIGLTKGVLFKFTNWDYGNFYFIAPTVIAAGIIGPILIEWMILRRIPFIKEKILKN